MAKDQALEVADLETATQVEETTGKAKKAKKELTAEEIAEQKAALEAGVAKITEFGVSEKFAKVLALVVDWTFPATPEDLDAAKTAAIENFGGSEAWKDYISEEFEAELSLFQGLNKATSMLNNIRSFYSRRASTAGTRKKSKLMQITISGVNYNVSEEYFAEVAELGRDEKIEKLLAHPATVKVEAIEIL